MTAEARRPAAPGEVAVAEQQSPRKASGTRESLERHADSLQYRRLWGSGRRVAERLARQGMSQRLITQQPSHSVDLPGAETVSLRPRPR